MKIKYDNNLKIAGIGLVCWNRLGPEQWLSNYSIACLYGSETDDIPGMPPIFPLNDRSGEVLPVNSASLLQKKSFQDLLEKNLPGYDLLTYKPIEIPAPLSNRKFLMVDPKFTQLYENKVLFREKFDGKFQFPDYDVLPRIELSASSESYDKVMKGRAAVVLQDEMLSGGKGTFVIDSVEKFAGALDSLNRLSKSTRVVVSDKILNPRERSIQAVVTGTKVFTGPIQRQIIAHPDLTNTAMPDGDKFAGAQIQIEDQNTPLHNQAKKIAQIVGQNLQEQGYRGVFGIDMLLNEKDEIFVLEVNPRLTGVTPLLTALFRGDQGVPFYLLHLLELGGYDYEVVDEAAIFDKEGSLLMLHSLENTRVKLLNTPKTGTYTVEDGTLKFVSSNIKLDGLQQGEFVFKEYMPQGFEIKPGGRLATLEFNTKTLDEKTNKWYNNIESIITIVRQQIKLQNL